MDVKAVFVDAANTLLRPREPVGVTYARVARHHGIDADPVEVQVRFRDAMRAHRHEPQIGDGRAFWRPIVAEAVGVDHEAVLEALYAHYAHPRAWWIDRDALEALGRIARSGARLGIISNWDLRLRTLYGRFALDRMFPVLICSAEVGFSKPDPAIFQLACECAGVRPGEAVHIGDDAEADVAGAAGAGMVGLPYDEDLGWNHIAEQIQRLRRPFWR